MATDKKKIWTYVLIGLAILAIALVVLYFSTRSKHAKLSDLIDPVTEPKEPLPSGYSGTKWVKEKFPLNVGMYGEKIRILQRALGVKDDGAFGNQTWGAVTQAGYLVPIYESDYNTLIEESSPVSTSASEKIVKSKSDLTAVYLNDSASNPTFLKYAKRDSEIGELTSEDSTYYYMRRDGDIKVRKTEAYLS